MRATRQRLKPVEAELWGEMIATSVARRELEERLARPRPWRRAWRWAWHRRAQSVPVVIVGALLAAAMTIREQPIDPFTVGCASIAALFAWWRWRARRAAHPFLVMLRPTLAALYLFLSSVMG